MAKNQTLVKRERYEQSIAVRIPDRLADAIKRESRSRCISMSAVVRQELARAFGLSECQEVGDVAASNN